MSFDKKNIKEYLDNNEFTWNQLITGFNNKKIKNFNPNDYNIYELHELYDNIDSEANPAKLNKFLQDKAIIDYIDTNETEGSLIAMNEHVLAKDKINKYTHVEIHESLIFGTMCNLINFPENNPATRNSFSCGQSKQACSMYHTNHQVRMDKTAVVLVSGQNPLVKTRFLNHINNEENPYGENAIVAVMCYTGYNVEDAILVNEGALKRGLFRTTYYSTYELHEEKSQSQDTTVEKTFTNIESHYNKVVGTKPGYDYSKLDKHGIVKENTELNDKTVLIGLTTSSSDNDIKVDASKTPKKGQLGIVDKTFITEGEEGTRIAKVRVREERIPNLGDKMASRAGQKGTVGLVIPEADMPFNKDGIRPDLIINPHAIPSRMTIGQFVETITGKACATYGAFGDCTAFNNEGTKNAIFGNLLCKAGYHSSGNEILYNGMTGEQLEVDVFMGPNYYMRLKHMVKDKINYRASGPMTALTKQPVSGRANDGGLRIGEMERDGVISHGANSFLQESMMERADKYKITVCNTTGLLAIYNPFKNVFYSPMADGPIHFTGVNTGTTNSEDIKFDSISKFGRDFSIIRVPYSFKLLLQELQAINVQMRLITSDNIEQIENMSYSNNIKLLMKDQFATPELVVKDTRKTLNTSNIQHSDTPLVENIVENTESPIYNPNSPAHQPTDTEIQNVMNSITDVDSPEYAPYSPAYNPNSPAYNPNSPVSVINDPSPRYSMGNESPEYAPYSPAYVPNNESRPASPDYPPDSYDLTDNSVVYNKGDNVHFRGDSNPERIWSIKNIGDKFITIETMNTQGLDIDDRVKVVTDKDIYKPGDFTNSSPNIGPIYDEPVIKPQEPDNNPVISSATPTFNIKIVNGNDMTEQSGNLNMTTDNKDIIEENQPTEVITNTNIPPIKMKPQLNENIESADDIDFKGGLVIKKV
jgi:hypothetical protein